MSFCANCGSQVGAEARFCRQCGASRAPEAAPSYYQPAQTAIPPIQAIQGRPIDVLLRGKKITTMGFGDIYNLIFTERQVIFARFTGVVLAEMAQQAKDKSKAEGKGFFGRVNAQMRASSSGNLCSRYLEMAPEQIMSESPDNFAMDYSAVGAVKLKKGFENGDEDSIGTEYTDVEFETAFGKDKYHFAQSFNAVERFLNRFYPGKIRK